MTLIVLDILILNLFYLICQIVLSNIIGSFKTDPYIFYWAVCNGLWIILSFILGTYSQKIIPSFQAYTKRTIQVYLLWIILVMFYLFFSRELEISRLF